MHKNRMPTSMLADEDGAIAFVGEVSEAAFIPASSANPNASVIEDGHPYSEHSNFFFHTITSILVVVRPFVPVGPKGQPFRPWNVGTHQLRHLVHAPPVDGLSADHLVVYVRPDVKTMRVQ